MESGIHSLGPFVYCPLCGRPLGVTDREDLPRRYCPHCDRAYYHNPVPAAGGVILDADRVLLVQRKFAPRAGGWTFPAGFLEYFEAPADCARREVREETGLQAEPGDIFGVYAGKDDPRHTAILILYWMQVHGGDLRPGDDARQARFFAAGEVPDDIAFAAHRTALYQLFGDRLQNSWVQPADGQGRTTRRAGGDGS